MFKIRLKTNDNLLFLGFFVFYLLFVTFFHLVLLSVFSTPLAWTLTLQIHNLAHLYFLHTIKSSPWVNYTKDMIIEIIISYISNRSQQMTKTFVKHIGNSSTEANNGVIKEKCLLHFPSFYFC